MMFQERTIDVDLEPTFSGGGSQQRFGVIEISGRVPGVLFAEAGCLPLLLSHGISSLHLDRDSRKFSRKPIESVVTDVGPPCVILLCTFHDLHRRSRMRYRWVSGISPGAVVAGLYLCSETVHRPATASVTYDILNS